MLILRTNGSSAPCPSLMHQQRGAVLVMALFMVMVLSGALFYVAGNGEAIEHRNNGQGAADGAAYSAAVVNATAMNNLAVLNMIKFGATASLTELRAAQIGTAAGLVAAGVACAFFNFMNGCGAVVQLGVLEGQLTKKQQVAEKRLEPIIAAADAAQVLLMSAAPLYGMVRMEKIATSYKGVHGALPTVFSASLPVEYEDEFEWCNRLNSYLPAMFFVTFTQGGTSAFHLVAAGAAMAAAMPACVLEATPGVRPYDDAELGSDAYQGQAFVMQGSLSNSADSNIVRAAQWGRAVDGGEIDRRRQLMSRVHFAQAEYFLDGGGARDELLWSMKWKARLTRFWDMGGLETFESLCGVRWPGSPCAEFKAALTEVAPLAVH